MLAEFASLCRPQRDEYLSRGRSPLKGDLVCIYTHTYMYMYIHIDPYIFCYVHICRERWDIEREREREMGALEEGCWAASAQGVLTTAHMA